ncbi:MAG TPA: hypothetical protein VFR31_17580, partial [Thermoanaerobaculia bacterium]|nr:hypothetical protein [Thermoanaerobaculia bacterium]
AQHRDRVWLGVMLLNLVSLLGFGIAFTQRWGAAGMGAANYLLVGNLWMAWEVARVFGSRFRQLAGDLVLIYLVPLPFFALSAWIFQADSWPRFAASVVAAALAAGLLLLRYWMPFRAFFGPTSGTS